MKYHILLDDIPTKLDERSHGKIMDIYNHMFFHGIYNQYNPMDSIL